MNDQPAVHPIAECLTERRITTIAVIDDGVDPPTRADVAVTIDDFWSEVEEDDRLTAMLSER